MLAVVYLIFNEGYGGRDDLAAEAIRLGRALAELMPDEPEAHGLLALMLLHDARREARFATASSCCSTTRTARSGTPRRSTRARRRSTGARAAAAAARTCCRRRSRRCTRTSRATGAQIAALYARARASCTGSPVVELNRAVAVAEAEGAGRRHSRSSTGSTSTTTATSTRRGPSCCAGSGAPTKRAPRTARALALAHAEPERRFLERTARERCTAKIGGRWSTASATSGARSRTPPPSARRAAAHGIGLFCDSLPTVYDVNYLSVRTAAAPAAELAAEADAAMEALLPPPRDRSSRAASGLAADFAELGCTLSTHLVLAHAREPDRRVDTSFVREVAFEELEPRAPR